MAMRMEVPAADRASGLERLGAFLPRAAEHYARVRNRDSGPGTRNEVSLLSRWLRHRQLLEQEVIQAVLAEHGEFAARKFIEEIGWRTYWKGWMEQHPETWLRYRSRLAQLQRLESESPAVHSALERARAGTTGIACFDAWVRELRHTGYLHNHARMWFASIWIFTLKLPWEQGAEFFMRHLLDGDAAVNTLSWRWVGGLQTRGKHYLARTANIREFSNGRHDPEGQLDEHAEALTEATAPASEPLCDEAGLAPRGPALMLLTEEDLHAESWPLDGTQPAAIIGINLSQHRASGGVNPRVHAYVDAALDDALFRAAQHYRAPAQRLSHADTLQAWAARHAPGLPLVTAKLPIGPAQDALRQDFEQLQQAGHRVTQITRAWDAAAWPRAAEGFYKFRRYLPDLIEEFGLLQPQDPTTAPNHHHIAAAPHRKVEPCHMTI